MPVRMSGSRLIPVLLAVGCLSFRGHADPFPKDYFRSPLGIPLFMAGNFAEMRPDHFHSGLDLKTNNREGYRVYAAAAGYVSRIKVSATGFGHALYINHPAGYTTVYAHLSRFSDPIDAYVKNLQYQGQRFEIDTYPEPGQFPIKKGDVVAFSGNTGSSGGPHLHFEIRDAATQEPLNPLLFGLEVKDSLPPRIFRIKIYAGDAESYAILEEGNGVRRTITYVAPGTVAVEGGEGTYRLPAGLRIRAHGRMAFGIQTHDYQNGSNNRLGAYRITLEADDRLLFRTEMERFSFDQTRFINAHVDYAERQRDRRWVQRSFRLPGNELPLYEARHDGFLTVRGEARHRLRYTIEDAAGNQAVLPFEVEGVEGPPPLVPGGNVEAVLPRTRPSTFDREGLRLVFPANAFYDEVPFTFGTMPAPPGAFSRAYRVHTPETPVHRRYQLSITASALPERLRDRALIATLDEKGDVVAVGGGYLAGTVTARPRAFGTFFIVADTLAPRISPVQFRDGQSFRGKKALTLRVYDDLSGIDRYVGKVDGHWVLFEYDPKARRLFYRFDEHVPPGRHHLAVEITDTAGNTARYEADFTR